MTTIFGWMGNRHTQNQYEPSIEQQNQDHGIRTFLMQNSILGLHTQKSMYVQKDGALIVSLGQVNLKSKAHTTPLKTLENILDQYLRIGPQVTHQLEGQFLIIILLAHKQEVFMAQDRLGTFPIFYTKMQDGLFFGTDCKPFIQQLSLHDKISANAVYHYLYYHFIPSPLCIYESFSRLMPGHYLIYQNEHIKTLPYWHPTYQQFSDLSFEDKKIKLKSTLLRSVENTIHSERAGTFLSGGIDSTTLLGLLTEFNQAPVDAFTIGFDEQNFNEVEYAAIAAKTFRARHHIYYLQPKNIIDCYAKIQQQLAQPFGNASIIPAYYCAQQAKEHHISQLIAGDGGDELFGGNTRYAKQLLFSQYLTIPKSIRKTLIEPIALRMPILKQIKYFEKAARYIEQANTPMPQRLESYNLLNRIGIHAIIHPQLLSTINSHAPLQLLIYYYNQIDAKTMLGKMLGTDLKFTLSDNDLVKVTSACGFNNVDVSFPFLTDQMLDLSFQLSDKDKVNKNQLRYFYKRAMKDLLPLEIIEKSKHGFGMPFGLWLTKDKALRNFCFEQLHQFKHRTIVKSEFIDTLTKNLLHEHPSYYGVLCWVLMMLEGWLASQQKDTQPLAVKLTKKQALVVSNEN